MILGWLALMATCFIYNAWVIPFRYFFKEYQTEENKILWFFFDYCVADFLYLLDILFFKYRVMYMEKGFWVKVILLISLYTFCNIFSKDKRKLLKNYIQNGSFFVDIMSLLPLDLFYIKLGDHCTLLRLPRLLKIGDFMEFFRRLGKPTIWF